MLLIENFPVIFDKAKKQLVERGREEKEEEKIGRLKENFGGARQRFLHHRDR